MNKKIIFLIFLAIVLIVGCIEHSEANVEETAHDTIAIFIPAVGNERNYDVQGVVIRFHDDELNVTLYIYSDYKKGGITAIPDHLLRSET